MRHSGGKGGLSGVGSNACRRSVWRRGKRIALLGGSFNPPHDGHLYICRAVADALRPDRTLVLPALCNPLKSPADMAPYAERLRLCRELFAPMPRVVVSDLEARRGLRYSVATLRYLRRVLPRARFIWIIGSDNLCGLHRWRGWRALVRLAELVVVARGPFPSPEQAPALRLLVKYRVPPSRRLPFGDGSLPCWRFLDVPAHPASSTAIRAASRSSLG